MLVGADPRAGRGRPRLMPLGRRSSSAFKLSGVQQSESACHRRRQGQGQRQGRQPHGPQGRQDHPSPTRCAPRRAPSRGKRLGKSKGSRRTKGGKSRKFSKTLTCPGRHQGWGKLLPLRLQKNRKEGNLRQERSWPSRGKPASGRPCAPPPAGRHAQHPRDKRLRRLDHGRRHARAPERRSSASPTTTAATARPASRATAALVEYVSSPSCARRATAPTTQVFDFVTFERSGLRPGPQGGSPSDRERRTRKSRSSRRCRTPRPATRASRRSIPVDTELVGDRAPDGNGGGSGCEVADFVGVGCRARSR